MQSEQTESLLEENIPQPVLGDNAISKDSGDTKSKRKTWVLSYATQIIQTLGDICVNVAISQESDEQVKGNSANAACRC